MTHPAWRFDWKPYAAHVTLRMSYLILYYLTCFHTRYVMGGMPAVARAAEEPRPPLPPPPPVPAGGLHGLPPVSLPGAPPHAPPGARAVACAVFHPCYAFVLRFSVDSGSDSAACLCVLQQSCVKCVFVIAVVTRVVRAQRPRRSRRRSRRRRAPRARS